MPGNGRSPFARPGRLQTGTRVRWSQRPLAGFRLQGLAKSSNIGSESLSLPGIRCAVNSGSALPVEEVSQVAGRLRKFYSSWSDLTSDVFILSCIKGYRLSFVSTPIQNRLPRCPSLGKQAEFLMSQAIENFLHIGAVIKCKSCKGQFLSSYFF